MFLFIHRDVTFEERCAPYAPMVYRHCLRMLHHPQEAEDAAQETMLRAFRAYSSFHGSGVASWLFQIAHRTCLDVLKSARYRREHATLDDPDHPYEAADPSYTPEERYVTDAESRRLWDAVLALPEEQQTLIALYYGENLKYEEIAEATGLRPGTVKSRLSRAKDALRKKLESSL